MLYHFVKLISFIVCMLPLSLRRLAGRAAGELGWLLAPRRRRAMAVNNIMLSLAVDRREAGRIAKLSATRFGGMFMEVLCFPRINADNINQCVVMHGRQHLDEALSLGRGVVLATAHCGNWELLGAGLALNGYPLVAVVQKQTNAAMDRFINHYRTLAGMHVTYKTGVREMLKLLGEGKIIGLLMDQDAHSHGVFVDFFDRPASTPQGAAALARMKDAPIVPAFISEVSPGKHAVTLHPPVRVDRTDDKDRDIIATTQQLTNIIEQHIRKHPCEWFWLHNRWKTRPAAK